MANRDNPNGMMPVGHLAGGEIRHSMVDYNFASGFATSLFRGDPISLVAAGTIAAAGASGSRILGAFAGVQYVDASGQQQFSNMWTASTVATNIKLMVWDDPFIVYKIQADGNTVEADKGQNADTVATAGDTSLGTSNYELDTSTQATTAALQLRILAKEARPDNAWGTNVDLLVKINEHAYLNSTGI